MNAKAGTTQITGQIIDVLDLLSDHQYKTPLPIFSQSSIGQHFRHIINFYQCLLAQWTSGEVNYCKRERNTLIEEFPKVAQNLMLEIDAAVQNLHEETPLIIKSDFSTDQSDRQEDVHSSIGRELMFAYDHAIHHLALIKIGLQVHFPEVTVDAELGVAPSTLKYKRTAKAVSAE